VTAPELAAEADRLVGVSPRRARRVATQAVEAATKSGDLPAESAAHRADARAAWALGETSEALSIARRALRLAERADSREDAAEARMLLAYLRHASGDPAGAIDELDRAELITEGASVGRLLHQRGLILQESGRTEEALAAYRRALPKLLRNADRLRAARLHNNRGVLHAQRGALTAADADLFQARDLYRGLGQDTMAADATWNLGFVAARRGDAPAALALYDEAEAIHARHGIPELELQLDRCEVLLSVGLTAEARATAERAVPALRTAGMSTHLADGLLMLAQACVADGDPAAGRAAALRAARLFTRQQRPRRALIAGYVALRADERAGRTARLRPRALRIADQLTDTGWRAQELDCRLIAARAALDAGAVASARAELAQASAARRTGPMELRIRAWYAAALLRIADGNRSGAEKALQAGLRIVDRERAVLGATELRVHMAGHGGDLAKLGLELARASGSATKLLTWAESWRAGALHMVPARPPDDAALAATLAELRRVTADMESALLDGRDTAGMGDRKVALEERVRRLTRLTTGTGGRAAPSVPTVEELAGLLGDRVLVELVDDSGSMLAITVRDGQAQLTELGPAAPLERQVEAARFALRRLALRHGAAGPAGQALQRAAGRLDDDLLAPLRDIVADRPLVVIPPGSLQALPWSALPSCAERSVTVAPSAAVWVRAARAPTTRADPRVLLAAGPRLDGAAREIGLLARVYPNGRRLTGAAATAEATLRGLDGADVAHIAAHGRLRRDNPLFSALDLADGPLTVYDLERVSAAPTLVVLPACQSGVTSVLAGDEIMGLTAALFALGTTTIVATVVPVDDAATGPLMVALHRELRNGRSVADSLARARASTATDPVAAATAAGFVCYGAG
jgi:tetratricopeptide (TPR) repeat protein